MPIRASIAREWHQLCLVYYKLLLDGCLDDNRRFMICIKINQHRNKLAGIMEQPQWR